MAMPTMRIQQWRCLPLLYFVVCRRAKYPIQRGSPLLRCSSRINKEVEKEEVLVGLGQPHSEVGEAEAEEGVEAGAILRHSQLQQLFLFVKWFRR
jgi:hypothetical protein